MGNSVVVPDEALPKTLKHDWAAARAWLHANFGPANRLYSMVIRFPEGV
jgi:hypothetical protein